MKAFSKTSPASVAIIGAGAAGLVAARECLRQGFDTRIFEKSDRVGGVWKYTSEVEDDLLGLAPKKPLHGSLYKSLRTNLPRKLMSYRDFPFEAEAGVSQFVSHDRVRSYLENFARHFELYPIIEFNDKVESVKPLETGGWSVETSNHEAETYHAVIVGNGHYSKPRIPDIRGMETFNGLLMHSHNYRTPKMFHGKRVALFGAAASALDLSLEIQEVADTVYWCAETHAAIDVGDEIVRCGAPTKFEDGKIILNNGDSVEDLHAFIFCTGYHYDFPFLEESIVSVADDWVHPLYLDLIPPEYPSIAFVGLPYAVIPFPLFEIQVKWFTRLLAGQFNWPTKDSMENWCLGHAARLRGEQRKQRNFHKMGIEQYAYMDRLAEECGTDPLPPWFEPLAEAVRLKRLDDPLGYRDADYAWDTMNS